MANRLLACLMVVLFEGCAERALPPPPPDAGVSFGSGAVADFAARFSRALCELHVQCGLDHSVGACQRDLAAYWKSTVEILQADVDAGRVFVDPALADACVASLGGAGCPTRSAGPDLWSIGCPGLFAGTGAEGEPCVRNAECGSGYCRRRSCTDMCCLGSCADQVPVGSPCEDDFSGGCAPGSACVFDPVGRASLCVVRQEQGQPCVPDNDNPCVPGLRCHSGKRQCLPYPKDGEPCDEGSGCDRYTSYCDSYRHRCQARKPVGAACDGFDCVQSAACAGGVCVALPGAGERCASTAGEARLDWCRPAAGHCVQGVCQWPATDSVCMVETASVPDGGVAAEAGVSQ